MGEHGKRLGVQPAGQRSHRKEARSARGHSLKKIETHWTRKFLGAVPVGDLTSFVLDYVMFDTLFPLQC